MDKVVNSVDGWHLAMRGKAQGFVPKYKRRAQMRGNKWKVLQESPPHDKHQLIKSKEDSDYI